MKRYDSPAGSPADSRWFTDPDYAVIWCRSCGFDPRNLVDDKNPPKLERVHGYVFKKKE